MKRKIKIYPRDLQANFRHMLIGADFGTFTAATPA